MKSIPHIKEALISLHTSSTFSLVTRNYWSIKMVMVLKRKTFKSADFSHYTSAIKVVRSDAVWGSNYRILVQQ
jgi:hypothetical protein